MAQPSGRGTPARGVFGVALRGDYPFRTPLAPAAGDLELEFSCAEAPPLEVDWSAHAPSYLSPRLNEAGESVLALHLLPGCDVLRFAGEADFYLWPDRVACHLRDPYSAGVLEIRFFGVVMAYWLERRGLPVLHSSGVALGDHALGFLATHGGGKTTLAASLLRDGASLLTDDLLVVEAGAAEFLGRRGYPQLRMRPADAARWFGAGWERLELVHPRFDKRRVPVPPGEFGSFAGDAIRLQAIYVPERHPQGEGEAIEIEPISPRSALALLVRHSFVAPLLPALGIQSQRLALLAALTRNVPVRRLRYPTGYEQLSRVCAAVRQDAAAG